MFQTIISSKWSAVYAVFYGIIHILYNLYILYIENRGNETIHEFNFVLRCKAHEAFVVWICEERPTFHCALPESMAWRSWTMRVCSRVLWSNPEVSSRVGSHRLLIMRRDLHVWRDLHVYVYIYIYNTKYIKYAKYIKHTQYELWEFDIW